MYNLTPRKAKSIEKLKEETRQDNQDIAGKTTGQDSFMIGVPSRKAVVNKEIAAPKQEESIFRDEDFGWKPDDDYKDEKWQNDFITSFEEETGIKPNLTPRQQRQNQTSQGSLNTYNFGEEWLMSEGGGDEFWKAIINNYRSAIGGTTEDFARFLLDYFPNYKPAQNVLNDRTAGKIDDMAAKQFGNVKETTGAVGDKFVDYADIFSQNMGYNVFGFGPGNYLQAAGEGFGEYERLRNLGYSKEDALRMSSGKTVLAIGSTKIDDYIGKNNTIDDRLFGKNGIVDKVDDYGYNNSRNNIDEEAFLQNRLNYETNGEKMFIPENTKFESVKTIAGNGGEKPIGDIKRLVDTYGGNENDWKKQAGKINSDKYVFDVHWYELDSVQYEAKLKNRSNRR